MVINKGYVISFKNGLLSNLFTIIAHLKRYLKRYQNIFAPILANSNQFKSVILQHCASFFFASEYQLEFDRSC
jgi:hypothetical protein